jgi:hypothetical protein
VPPSRLVVIKDYIAGMTTLPVAAEGSAIEVRSPEHDKDHPANSIRSATLMVNGCKTDILLESFADRVFIVVTQLNKLGTIVREQLPSAALSGSLVHWKLHGC